MKKIAYMFPGQGSQEVGMGKSFYSHDDTIKEIFNEANQLLNKDITKLMFEGPKEELTETENAQPALLLSSIALHRLLLKEGIQPVMTVGHSLGEYSALVAAGSISLEEALPLVAERGRLMEAAFPRGQGTMAAVLGMKQEEIVKTIEKIENGIVDLANINCPGQIVISGDKEGMEEAKKLLKEAGAKRVLPLNVSGPFHSRLMKSANESFAEYLNEITIKNAAIPVYANVSAQPVTDSELIKDLLIKQLYSPVQFEASIRNMMEYEVDAFVEIGNGKVLSGLVKKIHRRNQTFAIHDINSLKDFLHWYKEEA